MNRPAAIMEADERTSASVEGAIEAGAETPFEVQAPPAGRRRGRGTPRGRCADRPRRPSTVANRGGGRALDVHYLAHFRMTVQDSTERRWPRPEDVEGCKVGALPAAPTAAALVRAGLLQPTGSEGYGPSDAVLQMTRWGTTSSTGWRRRQRLSLTSVPCRERVGVGARGPDVAR